jgi:copper chaperone CopZ
MRLCLTQSLFRIPVGVTSVETNVETKTVLVTADEQVSSQDMLAKLMVVSERINKGTKKMTHFHSLMIAFSLHSPCPND